MDDLPRWYDVVYDPDRQNPNPHARELWGCETPDGGPEPIGQLFRDEYLRDPDSSEEDIPPFVVVVIPEHMVPER